MSDILTLLLQRPFDVMLLTALITIGAVAGVFTGLSALFFGGLVIMGLLRKKKAAS